MNLFGDAVRQPIEAKKASGLQLTESIGITPTSVSQILNGQSRPRQFTLTRIMKRLCDTPKEEQLIVRTYTGLESLPQEAVTNWDKLGKWQFHVSKEPDEIQANLKALIAED